MDLAVLDVPVVLIYAIPAIFWIAVIIQYLNQSMQAQEYRSTQTCPRCKKSDMQAKIHLRSEKTDKRVSLIMNVGVGLILINLSIILLRAFGILMLDFIRDTNITGIQTESLLRKVGYTSFPLILGVSCADYGVSFIYNYFGVKKRKEVSLRCLSCNTEVIISGTDKTKMKT